MRVLALALVLALLAGCLTATPPAPTPDPTFGIGVVSAAHPQAAEAGARMLREGGNFVDAAAAVQWALNVVEPSMSGLGGGSLLLLWFNASKTFVYVDGREVAPRAATRDQFLGPTGEPRSFATASTRGYAVGVPGTVRAFAHALDAYGTRSLAETLVPASLLAREGFLVDSHLAGYVAASQEKLRSWPESARTFFPGATCPPDEAGPAATTVGCVGGTALKTGDRWVQLKLAATFDLLAQRGPEAFYSGPLAEAIVAAQAAREGRMTMADLAAYRPVERAVVREPFADVEVVSVSPPSAGGLTLVEMLKILEGFDLRASGSGTVDTLHGMIEAMHLAYADRYAYIGDSDFVPVPQRGLVHAEYAAERRARIDPERAASSVPPGNPWPYENRSGPSPGTTGGPEPGDHTTHFTVVDGWGNIAAVTTTLESLFGTGIMVPAYGFLLNNQLTDFDFRPGGPNEVGPGKRPRSSMAPTIVLRDGAPVLALGSPGGPTITTTVLQVVLNVIVHGMRLEAAVKAPRIFSSDPPNVRWEAGLDASARSGLEARGHRLASGPTNIGNVQALEWREARPVGVADTRAGQGGVMYVAPSDVRPS